MREIVLVIHNVRSAHNVGSMLRTADGLSVSQVFLSGYTPYPASEIDERLPHLARSVNRRIQKTALGAEKSVNWHHSADIDKLLVELKKRSFKIAALEQTEEAVDITKHKFDGSVALIVGEEISGLPKNVLSKCDVHLQIPMLGQKESFNVSVAAAMALYHLHYF